MMTIILCIYINCTFFCLLCLFIADINDPVLISNLPLAASVPVSENSALSSSVFQVSVSDQNNQTMTYSMSSSPGSGLTYFSLDSTSKSLLHTVLVEGRSMGVIRSKLNVRPGARARVCVMGKGTPWYVWFEKVLGLHLEENV